jgi:hypothetical protein
MRLRRIESSKATTTTRTTATATAATAWSSSAWSSFTGAAKSASAHHAAQHAHHYIRHIACSSTLSLRLRDCILYSLPDVVLAISGQAIGLSHRAIDRDGIAGCRLSAETAERRQLRS